MLYKQASQLTKRIACTGNQMDAVGVQTANWNWQQMRAQASVFGK